MEKKFWLIIIFFMIINCTVVQAATCTNGTIQPSVQYNNSWNNYNSSYTIPGNYSANANRINITNPNISNNNLWFAGTLNYSTDESGSINSNPSIVIRYGTSSNYIDITSYCTITNKRTNSTELFYTSWETKFTCSYQGNNSSANWLQVYQYFGSNYPITAGSYSNFCIQISPNDKDQIINNDNQNRNIIQEQIYEDYLSLWDKITESEEVTRDEIRGLTTTMTVTPHGQYSLDNTEANALSAKEGQLRGSFLDPYSDGNLNSYLGVGSNDTGYTNAMQWIWNIINRMIGVNSAIWILTSIILTLGVIKVVLSR